MSIKLGINGIGRIGKQVLRFALLTPYVDVVHINDTMNPGLLIHLLKYDSIHGKFGADIKLDGDYISVGEKNIFVSNECKPSDINWDFKNVDIVIESSGLFKTRESINSHLVNTNVKKIILSCPANDTIDRTVVLGVNHREIQSSDRLISNSSCTTNCVALMLKVIHESFGIKKAFMNTVHPATNNQKLIDGPHSDFRRARAAVGNIIPTTSSAIRSVEIIMPWLKDIFDGIAVRVPVIDGSVVELTAHLRHKASQNEVNQAFKRYSDGELKGLLEYCEDPVVSSDIIGNRHSAVFDALSTKVLCEDMIQILAWYDNESGYSARIIDLVKILASEF
jgi:glyceraldehyde 3-phosphate dehydrogenase